MGNEAADFRLFLVVQSVASLPLMNGSLTLGEIRHRLPMLDVRCDRCRRAGRLRTERLIEQFGRDMRLPDLRNELAGDCPNNKPASFVDRCRVQYPQLLERK